MSGHEILCGGRAGGGRQAHRATKDDDTIRRLRLQGIRFPVGELGPARRGQAHGCGAWRERRRLGWVRAGTAACRPQPQHGVRRGGDRLLPGRRPGLPPSRSSVLPWNLVWRRCCSQRPAIKHGSSQHVHGQLMTISGFGRCVRRG
jgi:hypothetical protein